MLVNFGFLVYFEEYFSEEHAARQGSYRVLLKSTCAFLFFFSRLVVFFSGIFLKSAFFGQKCAFFLLNLLFFHENTTILKVLDTKRQNFFQNVILCIFILKKFSALHRLA